MLQRLVGPGQQAQHFVGRLQTAGQHLPPVIHQGDGVTGHDFRRDAEAQKAVDRVLAHHRSRETALLTHRNLKHQHRVARFFAHGPGVNGLAQIPRQLERAVGFTRVKRAVHRAHQVHGRTGRCIGRQDVAPGIDPADGHQLRELTDQRFDLELELVFLYFLVAHLARQTHELFLALQQTQPKSLLGVFDISCDGLLIALQLFKTEVGDGHCDGRQEQQHRHQRPERGESVLS